jgi:hypothetical protein
MFRSVNFYSLYSDKSEEDITVQLSHIVSGQNDSYKTVARAYGTKE